MGVKREKRNCQTARSKLDLPLCLWHWGSGFDLENQDCIVWLNGAVHQRGNFFYGSETNGLQIRQNLLQNLASPIDDLRSRYRLPLRQPRRQKQHKYWIFKAADLLKSAVRRWIENAKISPEGLQIWCLTISIANPAKQQDSDSSAVLYLDNNKISDVWTYAAKSKKFLIRLINLSYHMIDTTFPIK